MVIWNVITDILYRQPFVHPGLAAQFSKPYATLSNIPSGNLFANATQANYFAQHNLQITPRESYLNRMTNKLLNQRGLARLGNNGIGMQQRGYHLKVGGIVVGSWADGVSNKSLNHQRKIMNMTRNVSIVSLFKFVLYIHLKWFQNYY